MNPETALNEIATIFQEATPVTPGRYHLRIVQKQLLLDKDPSLTEVEGTLAILLSKDINEGPTIDTWTQIKNRFAIFQKRGLI